MNQPSERTQKAMIDFFMKTSVPRILAAIDRGEMTWEEATGKKEVTANDTAKRV
ncbi:hypothetical protein [Anoxybacillus sp.]|uniref:hypothetical protein n=1 Tax=Anoxybacillus sp. TaxID=1872573 RepID=UPI002FE12708